MRDRTMNLKMYSRALRVRRMGSHCSPRLDTSRYLFNTDISFLGEKNRRERESEREREREKKTRKSWEKEKEERNHWVRIVISSSDVLQVAKLFTNSIFHSHRAERQIATEGEWKSETEEEEDGERGVEMEKWQNSISHLNRCTFHTAHRHFFLPSD